MSETENANAVKVHTLSSALSELNTDTWEVLNTEIPQDDESKRWGTAVTDASSLKNGSLGRPCNDTIRKWHEIYQAKLYKYLAELCQMCIPLSLDEKVNLLADRYKNQANLLLSAHENKIKKVHK